MIVGCQKSMWLLTNVLLVLSISLLQTASSTPTPPERRGLKDILFGKATLPNYSLPSARAPTPSINDQENQQFYQMVMHRKFQTCADFQASLRTLDPLKISQSAFNKALVALDLSTADIHTGFTGKDHEEMFQERTWANWLKKQKNNFVHGDSQHGKNPDRCSKFESATAIMELVGTIGVASSPSTAPPTSSSADSNAAENAVLVRLFDLQEETIESLGKGQVGSYLHRNMFKTHNQKMSTAGSIAVVGVKVYFIGVEAFKVIKASPIVGTALVAGAVGVKGALHEEIADGVKMIDTGVRVVASAPTAPFAIHQGIKKQRLTKEEMSVYGAREKATDLNLLVVDTQTEFVPLPRCFTGDEILMDLVKHRKQMSLPDFNDRVDGFISSKEMMDTLSVVGFNKALQQLTKSTKPRMASVKLKFSKNFKEAFGLKSALGYYGEAWKAAIAHAKGDYKHADRGGRNEFVGALLRIGDRMTTEDVPGGKLISAKTIRKLERSQIISVANAEMRARKQSRLAQTAQASVGLGAAAGSAVVVGGVVGLLPTVALLAGMPVVAPGISVSAFKHIFNYGQVALELTLHSNTRRKAKLENAKLVGMLDGKKNV